MSIVGIVILWVFAAFAFYLMTRWPMGRESDRRTQYWARFEKR
jgi:hypothetical protein